MKKLLALCLSVVAVFCVFSGCEMEKKDNNENIGGITVIDNTQGNEADNGQNNGQNNEETNDNTGENEQGEHTAGKIVQPITNGGDFAGENYN